MGSNSLNTLRRCEGQKVFIYFSFLLFLGHLTPISINTSISNHAFAEHGIETSASTETSARQHFLKKAKQVKSFFGANPSSPSLAQELDPDGLSSFQPVLGHCGRIAVHCC
jgi:hypothetical protein